MGPQGLSAFLGPVCKQNVWHSPASFAPNCQPPSDISSAKPHAKISALTHQTRRKSSWHSLPLSSDNPSALFSPSLVWSIMLSTFQEFPQWSFTSSVTAGRQQPLNARCQHKCKTPERGGRASPAHSFCLWQLSIQHPQVKAALARTRSREHEWMAFDGTCSYPRLPTSAPQASRSGSNS